MTTRGGRTAHAALVARQMGKPIVVGCSRLVIDLAMRRARIGDTAVGEREWISIDGDSGAIYVGRRAILHERPTAELAELDRWRQAAAAVT